MGYPLGQNSPSPRAYRITPHATNALPEPVRVLRLGVGGAAGNVDCQFEDGTTLSLPLDSGLPIGPLLITHVIAGSGTTATNIDGFV